MAEELKHLIEQIQREGVEKAEQQAEEIISQAKEKAAKIVKEAEEQANKRLKRAQTEADAFAERSVKTLEQAARDLLITVGQGCEKVITAVLGKEVDATLNTNVLEKMILQLLDQNKGSAVTLSVSEADKKALAACCAAKIKSTTGTIEMVSDTEVLSGFKIGFKDKNVYLDYTGEAVASALAAFLRPELAKTVSAIARQQLNANA